MKLIEKKIIDYLDEKYIVLSVLEEENQKYAFANKLNKLDHEPTDDYCILKEINDDIEIVINQEIIYKLFPKFQEKLKNDLNQI